MYMKQIKRGTVHEMKIITHNFVCRKNNLPLVILKKKRLCQMDYAPLHYMKKQKACQMNYVPFAKPFSVVFTKGLFMG